MADDPVVIALSEVAGVMFPTVYAPDVQVGQQSLPNPDAIRQLYALEGADPAYSRAVDAIGRDPALAPLLGDAEEADRSRAGDLVPGAFITTDMGTGWLIQSVTHLPGAFVQTAARYVLATGLSTDSISPLLDELSRVVPRVRRLVAGEPDNAAVLMGFHGIGLANGAELKTPWGRLRAASSFERSQRPFGGPSPSVILETTVSLRWTLGERDATISKDHEAIANHADLLALAVLLALGRGRTLQWLWQTTLQPLALGNEYRGRGRLYTPWIEPPEPDPLTEAQAEELITWSSRVTRSYHPSIAVAMHRTLSAVAERRSSPEDTLIGRRNCLGESVWNRGHRGDGLSHYDGSCIAARARPDCAASAAQRIY